MDADDIKRRLATGRQIESLEKNQDGAEESSDLLNLTATPEAASTEPDGSSGLLDILDGTWKTKNKGWNLIALPFKDGPFDYRLLMNQYGETLEFSHTDKGVPNRGIDPDGDGMTDQVLDAIGYKQLIDQVAADDSPSSKLRARDGEGLHHEPGLFLHLLNHQSHSTMGKVKSQGPKLEVARLGTIPHGDTVLALGTVEVIDGPPVIPDLNALPLKTTTDINGKYLAPYKHFEDNPFFGTVPKSLPNFPGFFSSNANAILQFSNPGSQVKKTTILHFDTKFATGGIVNIPFITKQADATEMQSTFWIMEVESDNGTEFIMQYSQTVFLDFFKSKVPGERVRWPHVSINTLKKT